MLACSHGQARERTSSVHSEHPRHRCTRAYSHEAAASRAEVPDAHDHSCCTQLGTHDVAHLPTSHGDSRRREELGGWRLRSGSRMGQ